MQKTKDLCKEIGDIKETFHVRNDNKGQKQCGLNRSKRD